jgi:hypothetical protein
VYAHSDHKANYHTVSEPFGRRTLSLLLDSFDVGYVGRGNYVVVVLHVGGSKAFDIEHVLKREPRTGKTWFPADSILHNEEHVDVPFDNCSRKLALLLPSTILPCNHVR